MFASKSSKYISIDPRLNQEKFERDSSDTIANMDPYEMLDEALCYGWIDGQLKSGDSICLKKRGQMS